MVKAFLETWNLAYILCFPFDKKVNFQIKARPQDLKFDSLLGIDIYHFCGHGFFKAFSFVLHSVLPTFDIDTKCICQNGKNIDHLATLIKMLSITLWPCLYLTFTRHMVSFARLLLLITYQKHYQKLVLKCFPVIALASIYSYGSNVL